MGQKVFFVQDQLLSLVIDLALLPQEWSESLPSLVTADTVSTSWWWTAEIEETECCLCLVLEQCWRECEVEGTEKDVRVNWKLSPSTSSLLPKKINAKNVPNK